LTDLQKNLQISHFVEIRPGRTHRHDETNSCFSQFCEHL